MVKPSTILIVDDDKAIIEQLTSHFRRRNYEPIATANPTMVEQILAGFEVHLIILDLRMPRLNGYDLLRKLREKNIEIPVLIITAYYSDEKEKLNQMGVSEVDVIEKPIRDFSKIEDKINKKLNLKVIPGEVGSDYEDKIYYNNRTKLVLVDDEEEILDILKEIFGARRYEVIAFTRGNTALEYILNNECHVIITDMQIPGLSGEKLIQQALQVKPNLKFIPFSGAYRHEIQKLLVGVGFDPNKLMPKPFDQCVLVEQVKVHATEMGTLG